MPIADIPSLAGVGILIGDDEAEVRQIFRAVVEEN
jgi:hypothetical protein